MITKLSQIVEEAQKKGHKRLAVAYGQDSHTLSAVYDAYKEGLVEPTLYGDKQVIEEVCGAEGIDCSIFMIVDEKSDVNCVRLAVAGDPDCLLFPNNESANVFFKAATHFGGAELAAMVMGTKVPCVLTSRGDSRLTKMYSIALACLAAR